MKHTLSCDVVRDLLPLYIDHLTSEQTSAEVKAHLDCCEACRTQYRDMTGAEPQPEEAQPEIDYLKKVNRSRRRIAVIAISAVLATAFVGGAIALILGAAARRLSVQNNTLVEENEQLTEENTILTQERYELIEMQNLLELSETYYSYNKVGARVIAKDPGNWYDSFIIDKGTDDGLALDMNVIAGGGLIGRITKIGPNWARVTSIISDGVNVSGQVVSSDLTLIVSGDLDLTATRQLRFSQLSDPDGEVLKGAKVVTSNISDKYLPGLLIGYIDTVTNDANNLTRSGTITCASDFDHLETVLVITDMKINDYE